MECRPEPSSRGTWQYNNGVLEGAKLSFSGKSARWLGIFLVGTLLLAPGMAWATGEDVQEADSKSAKTDKQDKKDEQGKKEEPKKAPPETSKKAETVDPSFSTLEDIAAFSGSLALLWAAPSAAETPIEWRTVPAAELNPPR